MGFTVVDVNMRGTGCSGGAFDFFEPLQSLDGYDVVETIARQPWVQHDKVGMMGISYGGISQLFTAQTNPPSLAAISPLSVIDATQTTLYPGGILNTGFAVDWAKERHPGGAGRPGPTGGQPWAYKRIQEGDKTCKANQALHGEAADLMAKIRANDTLLPEVADPLSPVTFVDKIKVPDLHGLPVDRRADRRPLPDARLARSPARTASGSRSRTAPTSTRSTPETFNRWYDFLQLYVAETGADRELGADPRRRAGDLRGGDGDHGRDAAARPDPAAADLRRRRWRRSSSCRRSASCSTTAPAASSPASPVPAFEHSFAELPDPRHHRRAPGTSGAGGTLADAPPARARAPTRSPGTPATRPLTNFTGNTAVGRGRPVDRDAAVPVVAEPGGQRRLVRDRAARREHDRHRRRRRAASGCARRRPNVDLQATISEVRPDGKETFVQGGWLRGRACASSTPPRARRSSPS